MPNKKSNIAVVFPGQGSQSVGMIGSLYENFSCVRETYEQASNALGFDLWKITHQGPKEILNQTTNTQPAMLVAGVATWRALQQEYGFLPQYFAGHSLGEYTALVASGQIQFEEAVKLSRKRAVSMQSAVPDGAGAMAAIIGLDSQTIADICQSISIDNDYVWPANDNAPGQVVIAGNKTSVEKACDVLKEAGAKRALLLPVSVPSHCPLMQPAAEEMKSAFLQTQWQEASVPVIHNSDVNQHFVTSEIVNVLSDQLTQPVRWVETVNYLSEQNIDTVIEVGPGKVLSGLNKRINKSMSAYSVYDTSSLNDVVKLLTE